MGKKVLIIDDDPSSRALLEAMLTPYQFNVMTAHDGLDGLTKIKNEKPDAIILDVLMPNLSGYDMMMKLREMQSEVGKIPVIVITAKPKMRDWFELTDITAFITKPLNQAEILEALEKALGGKLDQKSAEIVVKGGGRKVFLAGIEEAIIKSLKEYLDTHGFMVNLFFDDSQLIRYIEEESPAFVMCQFWENTQQFSCEKVYKQTNLILAKKKITFICFCAKVLELDVDKFLEPQSIVSYVDAKDLVQKIDEYFKKRVKKQ